MPITDITGESKPESNVPGHELQLHVGIAAGLSGDGRNLLLESAPSAHAIEADEGQGKQRGNNDEELENFVVNSRREPTHRDVRKDDNGGNDKCHPEWPAQQPINNLSQKEEIDTGNEELSKSKAP